MSMEYITIGLVCILGFFITYMYLKSKKNKETAKSPQQAKVAKIQTVEDLPKPVQNALKQPVGSILTGVSHHIKPIICPECIAEQTRKMNLEKENGAQPEIDELTGEIKEGEHLSVVMVFDSWEPYAAHVLQKHPTSSRIPWAISSTRAAVDEIKKKNQELPKNIKILVDLIESHGISPEIAVGSTYGEAFKTMKITNPNEEFGMVEDWSALFHSNDKPKAPAVAEATKKADADRLAAEKKIELDRLAAEKKKHDDELAAKSKILQDEFNAKIKAQQDEFNAKLEQLKKS